MYAKLYDSFVNGYSRFYGASFAHTVATWMLAALAFANSFSLAAWLAQGGMPGAVEMFRVLRNPLAAVVFATAWLALHYVLSAHYKRVLEKRAEAKGASKWLGNQYTLATVCFCIYVSKGFD